MNALVLGGAGHIGSAMTRALSQRGWQVTVVGRRPRRPRVLAGLPVTYRRVSDRDPSGVTTWGPGHQLVIDAAAPYPVHVRSMAQAGPARTSALARTRALLGATRRLGAQLVYVSSFVTLPAKRAPLDARRAQLVRRLHPYFALKTQTEALVVDAARRGLPAVIVNPTTCIGPWDGKPRHLCPIPRILRGGPLPRLNKIVNVVDVRDVAALALAAVRDQHYGQPLLVSGHNVSSNMLIRWLCDLAQVPPPAAIPMTVDVALGLTALSTHWRAVRGQSGGWRMLAAMLMSEMRWLPTDPVAASLGLAPRPLSRTLADTITWYRHIGYC